MTTLELTAFLNKLLISRKDLFAKISNINVCFSERRDRNQYFSVALHFNTENDDRSTIDVKNDIVDLFKSTSISDNICYFALEKNYLVDDDLCDDTSDNLGKLFDNFYLYFTLKNNK